MTLRRNREPDGQYPIYEPVTGLEVAATSPRGDAISHPYTFPDHADRNSLATDQAFGRAAGALLMGGNAVELQSLAKDRTKVGPPTRQ